VRREEIFSRSAYASRFFLMPLFYLLIPISSLLTVTSCSFDYETSDENAQRGIVLTMWDMEYVSVSGGNPSLRVRAEEARRYEEKHSMELENFSFERFAHPGQSATGSGPSGLETDARGGARSARIELDTGNFSMNGDVSLESVSEDISIEAESVSWRDKEKALSSPGEVKITRSDGTVLSGRGFSADTRSKTWELEEAVEGNMVEESN
jgi:LPS export ABC transporter protein LptC